MIIKYYMSRSTRYINLIDRRIAVTFI